MSSSKIVESTAIQPEFKLGDLVDYQESNGDWCGKFAIKAFEHEIITGLRWVIIKYVDGDGVELRVPYKRLRLTRIDAEAVTARRAKELAVRAQCHAAWVARCAHLNLKEGSVGRAKQLEAFLQCYASMGIALGLFDNMDHIQFFTAVGRGEEFLSGQHARSPS